MSTTIYHPETGEGFKLHTREEAGLAPARWTAPLPSCDTLVRHHTVTTGPDSPSQLRAVQSFHFSKGWADIAYGFGWDDNGDLWTLRGAHIMGGATLGHNAHTVACVYVGNADVRQPTDRGFRSLLALEAYIDALWAGHPSHTQHRDYEATACPGRYIDAWTDQGSPNLGAPTKPKPPTPTPDIKGCKFKHQGEEPRRLLNRWPNNPKTYLRGNDVAEIQFLLQVMDPTRVVTIDGIYGPQTTAAVARFQRIWNFFHPDIGALGQVGPKTRAAICHTLKDKGIW